MSLRYLVSTFLILAIMNAQMNAQMNAEEAVPAVSDRFAGKTVKDSKMGRALIQARSRLVPKLGTMAPDFDLQLKDKETKIKLSQYRGKTPVVLVFGSYT